MFQKAPIYRMIEDIISDKAPIYGMRAPIRG